MMKESDLRDCLDGLRQAVETYGLARVIADIETSKHRTWQAFNVGGRRVILDLRIVVGR